MTVQWLSLHPSGARLLLFCDGRATMSPDHHRADCFRFSLRDYPEDDPAQRVPRLRDLAAKNRYTLGFDGVDLCSGCASRAWPYCSCRGCEDAVDEHDYREIQLEASRREIHSPERIARMSAVWSARVREGVRALPPPGPRVVVQSEEEP